MSPGPLWEPNRGLCVGQFLCWRHEDTREQCPESTSRRELTAVSRPLQPAMIRRAAAEQSGPARDHFPAQYARWTSLLQVLEGHSAAPSDSQRCEVKTPCQIRSPVDPPPNKQSPGVGASEGATLPWTFSTDTRRFPTVTGRSVVCPRLRPPGRGPPLYGVSPASHTHIPAQDSCGSFATFR